MTPLSQVNSGTLEVILLQKAAESALLSENAKKSLLENSTFGLFLRITLQGHLVGENEDGNQKVGFLLCPDNCAPS